VKAREKKRVVLEYRRREHRSERQEARKGRKKDGNVRVYLFFFTREC
jgi:hypothetical protein